MLNICLLDTTSVRPPSPPPNDVRMILISPFFSGEEVLFFYHLGIPNVLTNAQPPEGIHFMSWELERLPRVFADVGGRKKTTSEFILMPLVDKT